MSRIPVLLVKRAGGYRHPSVLAAVDPDRAGAKPLQLDRKILQAGSKIAAALHGKLHAVYAYVPVPVEAYAHGTSEEALTRMQAETAASAREKLRRATRSAKLPEARLHAIGRHPPDAIEQVAAQTHSSLVVMGAISRRGLKHLLFGSTAERVLDHLACDLLVVKPARLIKPLPRARRGMQLVYAAGAL